MPRRSVVDGKECLLVYYAADTFGGRRVGAASGGLREANRLAVCSLAAGFWRHRGGLTRSPRSLSTAEQRSPRRRRPQYDLGRVRAVLATETARQAASTVGADSITCGPCCPPHQPTAAQRTGRAVGRRTGIRSGSRVDQDIKLLLMIFLIVAIVILVLRAVD